MSITQVKLPGQGVLFSLGVCVVHTINLLIKYKNAQRGNRNPPFLHHFTMHSHTDIYLPYVNLIIILTSRNLKKNIERQVTSFQSFLFLYRHILNMAEFFNFYI